MAADGAQDERAGSRTTKPRGLDVSTLASTRDDALHCAGTVTKKPDRRRERGISRKAIAQGMPDRFGQPVVTNSCAFYFCARGCGRAKRPAFPAPSLRGNRQNSGESRRENAESYADEGRLSLPLGPGPAAEKYRFISLSFRPFGARTPPRPQPPHPWRLAVDAKRAAMRPLIFEKTRT
jgi:hypothetical protein